MEKDKLLQIISNYKDIPEIIITDIQSAIKIDYVISKRNILIDPSIARQKHTMGKVREHYKNKINIFEKNDLEEYGVFFTYLKDKNRLSPNIIINPNTYEIIFIQYDDKEMCDIDYVPLIYTPTVK